jgi:hypothetical protein
MQSRALSVLALGALLMAASSCAGDAPTKVATRDEPTSAAVDETDLPVTFESGQIRIDPAPADVAPRMTADEAYQAWKRRGSDSYGDTKPQVSFGIYSNLGQSHMTDAGIVRDDTHQPAWMILFHNVSVPASGGGALAGGIRYGPGPRPTPTTASGPPPTYIQDVVGFIDDATGNSLTEMATKTDQPDHPADQPPGAVRGASCPADFSDYQFGLHDGDGSPEPWPYNAATPPRGAIHGSDGNAYDVFGGEGSFDHPLTGEMGNMDSPDGVIVVQRHSADPCAAPAAQEGEAIFHHEPSHSGAVTITAFDGDVVRYRTAGGVKGSYNVVTDKFS